MRCIGSINIEGWIGFGISQCLCLCQHIVETATRVGHFGQNKITSAVDDASHAANNIGRQRLPQYLNDRYASGNSRFEPQCNLGSLCQSYELITVFCNQRFVGRDNMFSCFYGLSDQISGNGSATHQFHHHVYIGVANDVKNIPAHTVTAGITIRIITASTNMYQLQICVAALLDKTVVGIKYVHNAAADGAQTTDADF